jgi:prepilin-type N-terminal cleavage/methylation domain-containing protein
MNKNKNNAGFSLIELLIVVVLIAFIGLILVGVFNSKSRKNEDSARAEAASVGASGALEALSQLSSSQLENGGSFTVRDDRTIEITGDCAPQTCDWLVLPSSNDDSLAKGYPYDAGANPPLAKTVLLRRWRVDDVDPSLGLKEITVVVLPDKDSTQPLSIKKTRKKLRGAF